MLSPRLMVAGCVAALLGTAGLTSEAPAQANCEMYGKLAIQQQQENEARQCGLTGDEWNSDLKRHIDWCGGVPPDQWKVELQKRQQALDACNVDEAAEAAAP